MAVRAGLACVMLRRFIPFEEVHRDATAAATAAACVFTPSFAMTKTFNPR